MESTAPIDVASSLNTEDVGAVARAAPTSLARQPTKPEHTTPNEYEANDVDDDSMPENVVEFPTGDRTKKAKDYSDWVTVEKRRVSEGVYAHYVRFKDAGGHKKVGYIDYISIKDFNKRFSRRRRYYNAYKEQLVAIYKAASIRTRERAFPNSGSTV